MPPTAKHLITPDSLKYVSPEELKLSFLLLNQTLDHLIRKYKTATETAVTQTTVNLLGHQMKLMHTRADAETDLLNKLLLKNEADRQHPDQEEQNLERYKQSVKNKRAKEPVRNKRTKLENVENEKKKNEEEPIPWYRPFLLDSPPFAPIEEDVVELEKVGKVLINQ